MVVTFDLPTPPSVNAMYVLRAVKGKTGRSLSFPYRAWRDKAKDAVATAYEAQGSPVLVPPHAVTIDININRQSDIDNRIKAVLDVLGKALPGFDDRYVDDLRICRNSAITGARVVIEDAHVPYRGALAA